MPPPFPWLYASSAYVSRHMLHALPTTSLVLATVYVVSMLHFYSPSTPAALRDPAYRAVAGVLSPPTASLLSFITATREYDKAATLREAVDGYHYWGRARSREGNL
jgi:hypothetical protein